MKICIITHAFPPGKLGGAEIYAQRMSEALAKSQGGHRVIVITQAPYARLSSLFPKKDLINGTTFYRFYPLNIFSIYYAGKKPLVLKGLWRIIDLVNPLPALIIKNILKKEKPDIVHLQIIHGLSPLILPRVIKKLKIPFIQTLHSYGFLCLRCDLLRHSGTVCKTMPLLCRIFVKVARLMLDSLPEAIISPSQFCLDLHSKNRLFGRCRKIVLPNAIELNQEHAQKTNLPPQNTFTIVYAGRLTMNKGVHVLIEAFKLLDAPKAKLYIAGEGPWKNKLARQAGRDERISFVSKLNAQDLQKLYHKASVTVVPSIYYEPFGNVIIESFAAATPVIGSRIGGIPELIQDNQNGFLFEPGNVNALKEILRRLIENPRQLNELSDNAFESAKKYDIVHHLKELEKIYATAMAITRSAVRPVLQQGVSR